MIKLHIGTWMLVFFALCGVHLYACKEKPPERMRQVEVLFDDDFDRPEDWTYFAYVNGSYAERNSADVMMGGVMRMSASQGEDCDRKKIERSWTIDANMQEKLNTRDTMFFELAVTQTDFSGLGLASCSFQFHDYNLFLDLSLHQGATLIEITLVNWFVHEIRVNGNVDENYAVTVSTGNQSASGVIISVDACGPDLYAYAAIELEHFALRSPYFIYP